MLSPRGILYPLCLLLAAALAPGPAQAAGPVDLAEAVGLALKHNPGLKAVESEAAAAGAEVGMARSQLLPSVTFEERYTRTTSPPAAFTMKLLQERFTQEDFAVASLNDPGQTENFQTVFSVEQPLYVREAHLGLDIAKKEYSARVEDLERKRQAVALQAVEAYLSAQAARGFVEAAEKGAEDAREHLRIARLRHENGLGLYSDVLRAQAGLNRAEQNLISARKDHRVAERALGLVLGRTTTVEVSAKRPGIPLHELERYTEASAGRADLKSMEIRARNAREGVALARAGYFPKLGLGADYTLNDHNHPFGGEGDGWTVSAFLRWNIFDGTLRENRASRARHLATRAERMLEGLRKSVSFGVYRAQLGVEEAQATRKLARSALEAAQEGERLVRTRFENGLSPLVDLLNAQAALDTARAEVVRREADYLKAVAVLAFEGGTLLEDLGLR